MCTHYRVWRYLFFPVIMDNKEIMGHVCSLIFIPQENNMVKGSSKVPGDEEQMKTIRNNKNRNARKFNVTGLKTGFGGKKYFQILLKNYIFLFTFIVFVYSSSSYYYCYYYCSSL